jgi:hypothetical protein
MKKNLISLCALALSFVALSSCDRADEGTTQTVKFKVLSEVATKTHLVEGKTNWSKNDVIHVLGADGVYYKSDAITESGVEASEFIFSSFPQTPQYALYVGRTQKPVVEDGNISATLPSDQNMSVSHSFCNHANLTIGEVVKVDESTYGSTLKNVCGLMKVTVPSGITSVKIEGNDEETLSGAIYIDYNAGEPTWSEKEGANFVNIIPRVNSEGTYVGSDYYACVLPQTFEKGITVTLTDINGNTAVTAGSNPLTLKRNKVVELPNLNIPTSEVTLTFDFSKSANFPSGFPTSEATVEGEQEFIAENGNTYAYKFNGQVRRVSSCLALIDKQTMTFPVIDGKKLTSVIITGGNDREKNCYLTDAAGVKISDTVTASTTGPVTLTPYAGKTATSLYNSSSTLYISKLVLVYE